MNRSQDRSRGWAAALIVSCAVGCASTPGGTGLTPSPVAPSSAAVGDKTIVAIMAPPTPGSSFPTLPEFLGVPQVIQGTVGGYRCVRDRIAGRLGGLFPGLEPRPPLLLLADPANLGPDAPPSVQAAAKVKQEQDAGAQKAKAAAYLATVGCGCYEGVAEALAENLKDCSEEVRHATVKALREMGSRSCGACGGNSCCSIEVHEGLMRLAWEVDSNGCFVEPSQRVRRLARLALNHCCMPMGVEGPLVPDEGPYLEEGVILSHVPEGSPSGSSTEVKSVAWVADAPESHAVRGRSEPAASVLQTGTTDAANTNTTVNPFDGKVRVATHRSNTAEQVLASVNGQPIYTDDILPEARRRYFQGDQPQTDGEFGRMMREVLSESIDRKLLAQTAKTVLSSTTQVQIQRSVLQRLSDAIEQASVSEASSNARYELALGEELLRRQVDHDPHVAPHEVELHYHLHGDDYREPPRLRWRLYRINDESLPDPSQVDVVIQFARREAIGFRETPPSGFDPANIRMERHDWMSLDQIEEKPLRKRLEKLRPGEASEPWTSAGVTSFVVVTEISLGARLSAREAATRIKAEILARRRRESEVAYIAQLRAQANIQILQEAEFATP